MKKRPVLSAKTKPPKTKQVLKLRPRLTIGADLSLEKLHKWHAWLAFLYVAQGLAIVFLSTAKTLPVATNYLTPDQLAGAAAGHPVLAVATRHLFDVNVAYLVAALFFISAVIHGAVASNYRQKYESDLAQNINRAHWVEYGLIGGIRMVTIAFLSGIQDVSALLMVFVLILITGMMGFAVEQRGKPDRLLCWTGVAAGIVPWAVVAIYFAGARLYGGAIPAFMYGIYISTLLFFGGLALNTYMQHQKKGRWNNYLYGERMYIMLSVVASAALAWQVFAGTLRG